MQIEKAFILLLSIFLISGCVPFDEGKIRHEQTQEFQSDYIRLTENVLKEKAPLDLWDCIELALQNNLHVRQAELEAGIAKLERRIAFANFLPVIELSGRSLSLDHQPMLRAGETNAIASGSNRDWALLPSTCL